MGYMTQKELDALQSSSLDKASPFVIGGLSHSQLSIARHFGGCVFEGRHYIYISATDELVRGDVVKGLAKYRKAQRKVDTAAQGDLLAG